MNIHEGLGNKKLEPDEKPFVPERPDDSKPDEINGIFPPELPETDA